MSPLSLQTTEKLVVALITSLNAARRAVCCYPPEHPAIKSAFERIVAACLPFFDSRKELVFGFSRRGIIFNGDYLDTGNTVYADFAFTLFQRGIGAVTLRSPLAVDDLEPFIRILALKREVVLAKGGIEKVWSERMYGAVSILPVRYELFRPLEVPELAEGDRGARKEGAIWEEFLKELTSGRPPRHATVTPSPTASEPFPVDGDGDHPPEDQASPAPHDNVPEASPVSKELAAEFQDLAPDAVSAAVERTLWFLLDASSGEESGSLEDAIRGMWRTWLAAGRYASVVRMIGESLSFPMSPEARERLLGIFAAGMDDVLGGIPLFGKPVYPDAAAIIHLVGPACLGTLVDRLAEEPSMQMRRFIIDRIVEFGSDAKDQLVSALTDSRWYLIRNILIIFREMNEPSVAASVRPLLHHPFRIVREEAMKTLLHVGDTLAYARLAKDFQHGDRERRLRALRLCTGFSTARMFDHLSRLAMKSGATRAVYEERRAAVAALAESRKPEAIEVLTRILESRNLLAPRLHLKLQEFCLAVMPSGGTARSDSFGSSAPDRKGAT